MPRLPNSTDELQGLRAARWFRESTTGQFDNFGPDAQAEQQDRAISRYGLVDSGLSWSVASSGWKSAWLTDGWSDMMAAAKAGKFDVLVVGYASRFLRNLKQTLIAIEDQLHPAGVAVLFVDERVLSSDPNDWEAFTRESQAAEAFSRKHSKRVSEGYAAKRRRQGIPGGNRPPFGYIRVDNGRGIIPDPVNLAVVQRCYELAAAGMTDRQIATRTGLHKAHIGELLTNPLYKGQLRTGEAFGGGQAVDSVTWDKVQAQRGKMARRKPGRGALRVYPLARLIHCASCGAPLTADTGRFRHPYPACSDFTEAKPATWGSKPGESYDSALYDSIIPAVLAHVANAAEMLPDVMAEMDRTAPGPDPATITRIGIERDAATRRLQADRDVDAWKATMERLDREEAEANSATRTLPTAEEAKAYLTDLPRLWDASGPEERKLLTNALFERIDVLGVEEVTVTLTPEARERGWLAAWADTELEVPLTSKVVGYGRGERI